MSRPTQTVCLAGCPYNAARSLQSHQVDKSFIVAPRYVCNENNSIQRSV